MRKRGSIFLIFILVCILIVGCHSKDQSSSNRKYGIQPPIEKLYWGMLLKDIEKTLSIKNGVDGVVYNYEKPFTTIILNDTIKRYGYEATVYLEVADNIDEEWFPYKSSYLTDVKLVYTNIDGEKVKRNIIKDSNETGNDWIDLLKNNCTTWQSPDKIKDLSSKDKKRVKEFWNLLDEHADTSNKTGFLSVQKKNSDSINTMVLVYNKNGATLTYNGETAVQINQTKHN